MTTQGVSEGTHEFVQTAGRIAKRMEEIFLTQSYRTDMEIEPEAITGINGLLDEIDGIRPEVEAFIQQALEARRRDGKVGELFSTLRSLVQLMGGLKGRPHLFSSGNRIQMDLFRRIVYTYDWNRVQIEQIHHMPSF